MSASKLYFAQHGLAMSKAENPDRPLSGAGSSQTRIVAQHLSSVGIPVSQIFHSGKLRAQQTAELFASEMNVFAVSAIDHLSPNDDISLLVPQLNINEALYVGHLPHLDKLVSFLLTGDKDSGLISFQNSAVVCLLKQEEKYSVQWYLTPGLATG